MFQKSIGPPGCPPGDPDSLGRKKKTLRISPSSYQAPNDLASEFADARCNIDGERLAELQAAGVDVSLCGMVAIEPYSSGLYEPRDDGPPAVIAPCGYWDDPRWVLADLCAFYLDSPGRWWTRRGEAAVLGDLMATRLEAQRIHATPLQWAQAGGTGFCLLDWTRDPVEVFGGAGPLAVDRLLKNRLRKAAMTAAAERFDRVFP